jgi:hypothetical protein
METQFLVRLANKIKSIPKAENIQINKEEQNITFWINDIFVVVDPYFNSVGLVSTTIVMTYYYNSLLLARFSLSPDVIAIEDEKRKLEYEIKGTEEIPIFLVDEKELVRYLRQLSRIDSLEKFIRFAENEFKKIAGLS